MTAVFLFVFENAETLYGFIHCWRWRAILRNTHVFFWRKLINSLNFFYNPITLFPPEHAMSKLQELANLCQNITQPSSKCLFCHALSLLYLQAEVQDTINIWVLTF